MYGYLGKIGLLVPSLNTTMEHDFHRLAPQGTSVHVTRVPTEAEGTIEALEEMGRSAVDILGSLESRLGIPATSAVQSSLWGALKAIGDLPITGYGSLLAGRKVD